MSQRQTILIKPSEIWFSSCSGFRTIPKEINYKIFAGSLKQKLVVKLSQIHNLQDVKGATLFNINLVILKIKSVISLQGLTMHENKNWI